MLCTGNKKCEEFSEGKNLTTSCLQYQLSYKLLSIDSTNIS